MRAIALAWGVLAIGGMLVAFVPCLGALNWLNIPFAGLGLLVCVLSVVLAAARRQNVAAPVAGAVCCIVAMFFGLLRLAMGGGLL
jgi:uncharacterized membrane protein YjjP (DUF1212 family)